MLNSLRKQLKSSEISNLKKILFHKVLESKHLLTRPTTRLQRLLSLRLLQRTLP